jgi:glycosyltransferase
LRQFWAAQNQLWRETDWRIEILAYASPPDYDAILRYFGQGKIRAAYLARVLVKMRVGGESNRSLTKIRLKSREDYLALRRNKVGGLGALAWKNLSKLGQFF